MKISLENLFTKFVCHSKLTAEEVAGLQDLLDEVLPPEMEE